MKKLFLAMFALYSISVFAHENETAKYSGKLTLSNFDDVEIRIKKNTMLADVVLEIPIKSDQQILPLVEVQSVSSDLSCFVSKLEWTGHIGGRGDGKINHYELAIAIGNIQTARPGAKCEISITNPIDQQRSLLRIKALN